MEEDERGPAEHCLFCSISNGLDSKTQLLFQDDEVSVFRDIRPAASHHYLATPRKHIANTKCLTTNDLPLVDTLVSVGMQVLRTENGNDDDVLLGFHCPPFTSVAHLHLHVISPASSMSLFSRAIVFRADSWWFKTASTVRASLESGAPLPPS